MRGRRLKSKACIIVIPFGDAPTWHHGAANSAIMADAIRYAKETLYPIIVPSEMEQVMNERSTGSQPLEIVPILAHSKNRTIRCILQEARYIMEYSAGEYERAAFFAHESQMERVERTASRLGIKKFYIEPLRQKSNPFDPLATSFFMRNKRLYAIYEFFALKWYRLNGWA